MVRRRHPRHPWVFSNEVMRTGDAQTGECVVVEERHRIVGSAFYNAHSLIALRFYADTARPFDEQLAAERLTAAAAKRASLGSSHRLVFSECDGFPGLIVDRYGDHYVTQINCLGMDRVKEMVYRVLIDSFGPAGVYEKSDENLRVMEGLPPSARVVHGEVPDTVEIEQDGLRFLVDLKNGQKTGFFFDQRFNRREVAVRARGEVLDCFCYTGGFSIYAARSGAHVIGIDGSAPALELARRNVQLNGLTGEYVEADVFKTLRAYQVAGRSFDMIILDPPSFTKSRKTKQEGLRGYKEINLRAMQMLKRGGILATCSCSYHISDQDFLDVLRDAAADAKSDWVVVHQGAQAPDHPVMLAFPESCYLKAWFLERTN